MPRRRVSGSKLISLGEAAVLLQVPKEYVKAMCEDVKVEIPYNKQTEEDGSYKYLFPDKELKKIKPYLPSPPKKETKGKPKK
ncbi:MAG TPA: hypothetical protein VFG01_01040 [Acidobacteriota bacterium]|nr:hypothetical protein [Acidobacteriota bacterium]